MFPDGDKVFTKAKSGAKGGPKGWNDRENLLTSDVAEAHVRQGGNVGVALGYKNSDGWKVAALDVEESGVLPNPVKEWADIYGFATFESGHDGLNRLLKVTPEATTYWRLPRRRCISTGTRREIWNRWSRAEKKNRRPTQNYSKLTKDTVRAVVDMMTADHPLSLEFYRDMYRIDIRPLRVPPRRLCTGRDPRARGLRGRRRADRAVP
jgi:hypothetical protein